MAAFELKQIPIDLLRLDLKNPRFGLLEAKDEAEAMSLLVDRENIKELWGSIATRGYEAFEPLIGLPHESGDGSIVVIEGNRRLAACKTLLNPELLTSRQRPRVPALRPEFVKTVTSLPVAIVPSREDAAAYIGFKHVNGPATWSSLAKAKFGVDMLENGDQSLSRRQRMEVLTQELGDSRGMLLRVFVAYRIFEQAISLGYVGEDKGMLPVELEFSHLYTMLNNPDTREFIGIGREALSEDDVTPNPVPVSHESSLRELLFWLFGDEKVIKSQGSDRPKLQRVLASREGLEALRSSGDLNYAYAAAGLQKEDWLSNLYRCAALAKQVENDVFELSGALADADQDNAVKLTRQIHRYMKGLAGKLGAGELL